LSIVKYNTYKGHNKPEIFKVDDFSVTRQVIQLNARITDLNNSLFKNTINISKYFFRGRKVKRGGTRKSVKILSTKRTVFILVNCTALQLLNRYYYTLIKNAITYDKNLNFFNYTQKKQNCYLFFKDQSEVRIWKREDDGGTCSKGFR
jgi:hypothetical protein